MLFDRQRQSQDTLKEGLIAQYKAISDDMRFYSDQRFKVMTVSS
jgi:hypothetical protein